MSTGRQATSLPRDKQKILSLAFSPDGQCLATGEIRQQRCTLGSNSWKQQAVLTVDPSNEKDRKVDSVGPRGGDRPWAERGLNCLAFSPDSRMLAAGSWDDMIRLWDIASHEHKMTFKRHADWICSLAISPDGKALAMGANSTVRAWDLTTGKLLFNVSGCNGYIHTIAYSPNGKLLGWGDLMGHVCILDVPSGRQRATLLGHQDMVFDVAFCPDGTKLASASRDNTVRVWDLTSFHEVETIKGHAGAVRCLDFSCDGKTLCSAGSDNLIKVWDTSPHQRTDVIHGGALENKITARLLHSSKSSPKVP